MPEINNEKQIWRRKCLKMRAEICAETSNKRNKDEAIFRRAVQLPKFESSETVFLYASKPEETDTFQLIEYGLKAGKKICLPRCQTEETNLTFYQIKTLEDLEKSHFGVYEPIVPRCEKIETADICFVPGVAFDRQGYRIGYGKGYYDRFLKGKNMYKVGLCYNSLLFEKLPTGQYDEAVNEILTDLKSLNI